MLFIFIMLILFIVIRIFERIYLQMWLDQGDGMQEMRMLNLSYVNATDQVMKGYINYNPDLWKYQLGYTGLITGMLLCGFLKVSLLSVPLSFFIDIMFRVLVYLSNWCQGPKKSIKWWFTMWWEAQCLSLMWHLLVGFWIGSQRIWMLVSWLHSIPKRKYKFTFQWTQKYHSMLRLVGSTCSWHCLKFWWSASSIPGSHLHFLSSLPVWLVLTGLCYLGSRRPKG